MMSFIRRYRKNGRVYLAQVESIRIKGKVKQRFVQYLGRESDGKTILSCSVSQAVVDKVKMSGPLLVLHAIAKKIGLPQILGEKSNEILSMVYAHCLDFKSLNHMTRWFKRTDLNLLLQLEELTEKRLVMALDWMETVDLMNLQRQLFQNTIQALEIKSKGVVYDVTNTYFHGNQCRIAKYGHDKEKRKGYPLIQIGLAVTQEKGIPIFHKTFAGNIHDARTFTDVSTDLQTFGVGKGVAVLDRGISSSSTTAYLSSLGWKVLCGLKISEEIKESLRRDQDLRKITRIQNRTRLNQSIFYCQEKPFYHGTIQGRLILCFNKRKAQEQEESRYDEVEAARLRLKKGQTIKPEVQEFFDPEGNLIESRLEQAKEFDGLSLIFTTDSLPLQEVVKAYFDKDVVEKTFQSLKGVVRLRPVRHWLYNRVEAHVLICYLSCLILAILKTLVSKLDLSFQQALDELEGLYRVYLRDPKSGIQLGKLVALTKKQEKILRAIDKKLLQDCSE